jgi:hypothetical protein
MRCLARPLIMGILLASAAFSYAIATSDNDTDAVVEADSRGLLGSSLKFLSPTELGPVLLGTEVSRYLLAAGGSRPYEFFASDLPD